MHKDDTKYRSFFENSGEAMIIVENGELTDCNSATVSLLGYDSKKQILNTPPFKLSPEFQPDGQLSFDKANEMMHLAKERGSHQFEWDHLRKDGSVLQVEVSLISIRDNSETLLHAIWRDLSKRNQAEKALRESEVKLRAILNHHFQLTGLMDVEGMLLMANETAMRMIGTTEEEVVGHYMWETPWWRHSIPLQNKLKDAVKLAAKGDFVRFETEHPDAHGDMRRVDFSLTPLCLGTSKEVNFIIPEGRDITDFKKNEMALECALEEVEKLKERIEIENSYLKEEIKDDHDFNHIIGNSRACREMINKVRQVAKVEANVLILGESGTGKELIARAVHDLSPRNNRSLVKLNCAVLPENLIESELFGHERGAFTGALKRNVGRFELADKGTIFLDEIGDLPLGSQAKLLRIIQEGEFERLGSSRTYKVDVRIIAATNRNLQQLIHEGLFREDLYYRLNVFPIICPPLRERLDDIPILVNHFVGKYGPRTGKKVNNIPQDVLTKLSSYLWPGNIRELENIIERSLIVSHGDKLELGSWLNQGTIETGVNKIISLEDNERHHIVEALKKTSWRVSGDNGAAKQLCIKPQTLVSRMRKLGIKRPS